MFDALRLDSSAVNAHEEEIRLRVRELDDTQRKMYYERFRQEMKDPDTYAVLNYFFLAGFHHMYLGYFLRGAINLMVLLIGITALVFGSIMLGSLLITLILISELMALFRSQTVVTHFNNQVAEEILDDLTATY